jgi:FG-GAP-like repeat
MVIKADKIHSSVEDATQCSCTDNSNPNAIALIATLSGPSCADMSYPHATAVHFADLDGDGRAEYLWVGLNGEVTAYYNNGYIDNDTITDGGHIDWVPAGEIATGIGGLRAEIRFADLNGDGRADYLWVHSDGSVTAYLNGGQIAGSPTPANVVWLPQGVIATGIGKNGAGTRFADLAGVGRSDYIWVDDNGALTGYLNLGSPVPNGPDGGQVGWLPQGIIATGIGEGRWNTQFGDIGE